MFNSFRLKSLVIGEIILFVGISIVPVTSGYLIIQNNSRKLMTSKIENPFMVIKQSQLIPLLTFINGTGKTSKELLEIHDRFKFLLIFDFINAEAELKWGFLGLPLWEWFPLIFNPVGPYRFIAIGFFGDIQKIDDEYHIKGYCLRFVCGNLQ